VATALSEISRSTVTAGRTAMIMFGIDGADLLVTVSVDGELPADGIAAAARLMDQVDADGRVVRMTKRRPPGVRPDPRLVGEQLAAVQPRSALDELQRQNQDLIGALSDELEQTNRGVVALYAELDEKSERLRAASESKDRFWANVSHELRTP